MLGDVVFFAIVYGCCKTRQHVFTSVQFSACSLRWLLAGPDGEHGSG